MMWPHLRPFGRHRPEPARRRIAANSFEVEIVHLEFVGDLVQRHRARDAGVADRDVDLAEGGHHAGVGFVDLIGFGHVALECASTGPLALGSTAALAKRRAGWIARQDDGDVGAG